MSIVDINAIDENASNSIGCPTSGVAQRAMREAAPQARGVSKATIRRLVPVKTR
jgi:hypothetical protein